MSEFILAFLIWAAIGCAFVLFGLYSIYSASRRSRPFGFWANADTFPVKKEKVTAYNRALGKLWCAFGVIFILLGLPLISGDSGSPALILCSTVGVMGDVIAAMVIYITVIEKKYRE